MKQAAIQALFFDITEFAEGRRGVADHAQELSFSVFRESAGKYFVWSDKVPTAFPPVPSVVTDKDFDPEDVDSFRAFHGDLEKLKRLSSSFSNIEDLSELDPNNREQSERILNRLLGQNYSNLPHNYRELIAISDMSPEEATQQIFLRLEREGYVGPGPVVG